jgi:sporulation protein YlmC with PRC-barrel domain
MERRAFITICAVFSILIGATGLANADQKQPGTSGGAQMGSETMQRQSGAQTGMQQQMQTATQEQTKMQTKLMSMTAKQIEGKSIVNTQGEKLGKVQSIVQNRLNNRIEAVVSVGGFLGIGAKQVTIPVENLRLEKERLVLSEPMSKDQLKRQAKYKKDEYKSIPQEQRLTEIAGVSGAPGKRVTFQELDTDSNGYITPKEAQADKNLSSNWNKADQNADNQVDRAEFSAFEQSQTGTTKPSSGGGM